MCGRIPPISRAAIVKDDAIVLMSSESKGAGMAGMTSPYYQDISVVF
jgi:hypothetical protein